METKPITPATAGIVIGLSSVVLFLVYYFTGLVFQQGWTAWMPALVYAILVIVFICIFSNAKSNFVTFGECFGFGFKSICIASLIIFFFTLAFIYFTPEYKDQFMQVSREQARQNKQATSEQIEVGIKWVADHFMLIVIGFGLFINVLTGLIASLIGAAIAKKKPVTPFTQINQIGTPES